MILHSGIKRLTTSRIDAQKSIIASVPMGLNITAINQISISTSE